MTEISVLRAGGDDQIVEGNAAPLGDHRAPLDIDAAHLRQHDIDVVGMAENAADRRGDVRRREARGRHLVQERLKQMVIVLIDQGDVERRAGEVLRRAQPAEPGTDDDDLGVCRRLRPRPDLEHGLVSIRDVPTGRGPHGALTGFD